MELPKGVVTLETVVANVLEDLDLEDRYSDFGEKVLNKVIRGFVDLNIWHVAVNNIRVEYLPVSGMNTVDLPDDYVNYRKIGIDVGGQIWTLTVNEDMSLPRGEKCGEDIRAVIDSNNPAMFGINYGYYFPDHYRNGRFVGGAYGIGGGFNRAYYRIDMERRQIVLMGSVPKGEIVLEYISTGVSVNRQTVIPRQYLEVLIAWCVWKLTPRDQAAKRERAKIDYMEEIEKVRFLEASMTVDEFRDAIYQSFYASPKR
jgi:hypothetical protein